MSHRPNEDGWGKMSPGHATKICVLNKSNLIEHRKIRHRNIRILTKTRKFENWKSSERHFEEY